MNRNTPAGGKPSAYERWSGRAVATIQELLAKGLAPWQSAIKPGVPVRPCNGLTGRWYHGGNQLLLHAFALVQPYSDCRWLTYRQAQQLGAQVRKGERGAPILIVRRSVRNPDEEADEPKTKPRSRTFLATATVFNADQVDGMPSAPWQDDCGPERLSAAERAADAFAEATGAHIFDSAGLEAHTYGHYVPDQDLIRMRPRDTFVSNAEYYKTLFHELAHWAGTRLGRDWNLVATDRAEGAREELRAELAAFTLCTTLGVGFDPGRSALYADHHYQRLFEQEPDAYFAAARDAAGICRHLCELADPKGELVPRTASPPLPVDTRAGGDRHAA